jgi:hypothetical protein
MGIDFLNKFLVEIIDFNCNFSILCFVSKELQLLLYQLICCKIKVNRIRASAHAPHMHGVFLEDQAFWARSRPP